MSRRVLCSCVFHASSIEAAWSQSGTQTEPTPAIQVARVVLHDSSAYELWIDALVDTVLSTLSLRSPPTSPLSPPLVIVHVFGNVSETWIRYLDGKEGLQAHRSPMERDSAGTGTEPPGPSPSRADALTSLEAGDPDTSVRRLLALLPGAENRPVNRIPIAFPGLATATMMDPGTCHGLGVGAVVDLLMERCVTAGGKKCMRKWFAFPSLSDEMRASRLDTIEALVSQRHALATTQTMLRRIGSSSTTAHSVELMWKTQTLPKRDRAQNFLTFAKTLASLEDLNEASSCLSADSMSAVARARFLIESFLDEAQFPDGMFIRYGVCSKLDELKTAHFGMDTMMTRIMAHERERIPKELLRGSTEIFAWHLVHVLGVGVFVHVPEGLMPAYLEDVLSDWALAFEPGGSLQRDLSGGLYVSDSCRALNDRYGNTMLEIQDREAAFCNQLTDRLLQMQCHLSRAFDVVFELDCLCALAELAIEQGMCRPHFATSLSIQGGWHLLLRAASIRSTSSPARRPCSSLGMSCTPNDTEINDPKRAIIVIGGPGTGKGTYLEQVGIICFLGRLGSFVPATRAVIPPIDRIFSLKSCRESIHDSSFSAGTRVVAEMLRWGSAKSLFLLESFGSATISCDGVALAAAVIRDLAQTQGTVIFATHMRSCLLDALQKLQHCMTSTARAEDDQGDHRGENQAMIEPFFRVMHLATAEHSDHVRVPLYLLRDGKGCEDHASIEGGAVGFFAGGDRVFTKRVREVMSVMSSVTLTSLRRDPRFTIREALEAVATAPSIEAAKIS